MRNMIRAFAVALAAFGLAALPGAAFAQNAQQIRLTEKHIQGYIDAQKDVTELTEQIKGDQPDPKTLTQLDAAVKKYGFSGFQEFENVAANISLVFSGIDPEKKTFTQPADLIKQEIQAINADKSIPADERKQALAELNEALKGAEPVKYPENIELVKKNYAKIAATMQQERP